MKIDDSTSMTDLVTALTDNNNSQSSIYETYRKAADLDLDMRNLKDQERIIRYHISKRVS